MCMNTEQCRLLAQQCVALFFFFRCVYMLLRCFEHFFEVDSLYHRIEKEPGQVQGN